MVRDNGRSSEEVLLYSSGETPSTGHGASKGITRRSLFGLVGASAVLFGVGGMDFLVPRKTMVRPPGGQDERALRAGCNHCGRCVSACHTKAVGFATLSDGLLEVRTPIMRYNLGFCDFCGKCVDVCPTGALRPFDVAAAQAGDVTACRIGKAKLDRQKCLAWTSRSCNLCYEECPYDAVSLNDDGLPTIDEDRCNGCGVCEYLCPVLSLRSYIGGTVRAIAVERMSNS